jgi:hypothetical protein
VAIRNGEYDNSASYKRGYPFHPFAVWLYIAIFIPATHSGFLLQRFRSWNERFGTLNDINGLLNEAFALSDATNSTLPGQNGLCRPQIELWPKQIGCSALPIDCWRLQNEL